GHEAVLVARAGERDVAEDAGPDEAAAGVDGAVGADGDGVGGVLAAAAELLHPLEVALGGVLGDEAVPVVARRERDVVVRAAVPGGDAGEVAGIVDVALGIDGDVAAVVPEHVGAAAAGQIGRASR